MFDGWTLGSRPGEEKRGDCRLFNYPEDLWNTKKGKGGCDRIESGYIKK